MDDELRLDRFTTEGGTPGTIRAGQGLDGQARDGQARRRARTREALLGAGRRLLASGKEDASIEEITRLAGVGFGSFTNHFPAGKAAFFHTAALSVLQELGAELADRAGEHADPVEAVARGFHTTAMLARAKPSVRAVLLRPGTEVLFTSGALVSAAQADIERGIAAGCFVDDDPELLVVGVGSILIGALRLLDALDQRSAAEREPDATVMESATAAALRLLGVQDARARKAARDVARG